MNNNDRPKWKAALSNSFHRALTESIKELTFEEKADYIESLIKYVSLLRSKQLSDAAGIYDKEFLTKFRSKLKNTEKVRLFEHFDKDLAWMLLDIISNEVFNSLPAGEQGMTEKLD